MVEIRVARADWGGSAMAGTGRRCSDLQTLRDRHATPSHVLRPPPVDEEAWLPGLAATALTCGRFPRSVSQFNHMQARRAWLEAPEEGSNGGFAPPVAPGAAGPWEKHGRMVVGIFSGGAALGLLITVGTGVAPDGRIERIEIAEAARAEHRGVVASQHDLLLADNGRPAEESSPPPATRSAAVSSDSPEIRSGVARALRALGERQHAAGDVKAAALSFERAAMIAPDDAEIFYDWGYLLDRQGKLAAAVDLYREAIKLDPDHAYARYNLGYLMQSAGDEVAARDVYEAAVAEGATTALTHYNLGYLLQKAGDEDAAIRQYRAAVAADPDHGFANYNLGFLLEKRGDATAARTAYRRASEAAPGQTPAGERLTGLAGD